MRLDDEDDESQNIIPATPPRKTAQILSPPKVKIEKSSPDSGASTSGEGRTSKKFLLEGPKEVSRQFRIYVFIYLQILLSEISMILKPSFQSFRRMISIFPTCPLTNQPMPISDSFMILFPRIETRKIRIEG